MGSCPLRLLLAWCLHPHPRLINMYLLCTFVNGDDRCAELRAASLYVMRCLSVMGGLRARSHVIWQEERRRRRHLFLSQALTSARVTRRPPSMASNSVAPSTKPTPHKKIKSDPTPGDKQTHTRVTRDEQPCARGCDRMGEQVNLAQALPGPADPPRSFRIPTPQGGDGVRPDSHNSVAMHTDKQTDRHAPCTPR